MYIYEGHMGGFYSSEEELDYEYLYCESCGDSDTCLGWFDNKEDLRDMLYDYYDCNYDYSEVSSFMSKEEYEEDIKERISDAEEQLNELWYEE